jgi:hypothetical protein
MQKLSLVIISQIPGGIEKIWLAPHIMADFGSWRDAVVAEFGFKAAACLDS